MTRSGTRLSDAEQRYLLRAVRLRRKLTDKALAERLRRSPMAITKAVARLRMREQF
jgi:hypothetical protein